jgi:hypothetical protein
MQKPEASSFSGLTRIEAQRAGRVAPAARDGRELQDADAVVAEDLLGWP